MSDQILDKAIEEIVREMTPEERDIIKRNARKVKEITPEEREVIIGIIKHIAELSPRERDKIGVKTLTYDLAHTPRTKLKMSGVIVEHNSFLEPITSDMCRTTKSYPRKGYTSVSRIAKG